MDQCAGHENAGHEKDGPICRENNYLVEVVKGLVEVGHHAGGRFVCNFNRDFQDALWDSVRLA